MGKGKNYEGLALKHYTNIGLDERMRRVIEKMQKMEPSEFRAAIEVKQQLSIKKRELRQVQEQHAHPSEATSDAKYSLICGKCNKVIAAQGDVRCCQGAHHLAINEDIFTRVTKKPREEKRYVDIKMNGLLFCAACNHPVRVFCCRHSIFYVTQIFLLPAPVMFSFHGVSC